MKRKMKNLTLEEELKEELIDLAIVYEELPKGSPYAEELYETLIWLEGMVRSAEAMRENA
jgi:hypothetical protein